MQGINKMGWEEIRKPCRKNGRFIVLEGVDGCGSTTQLHELSKAIFNLDKRYSVSLVREPSNGVIGQIIRRILSKDISVTDPDYILALWQGDRYEHLAREVLPALEAGMIALQDRYWYSTLCYQETQGVDVEKIIKAHEALPIPDMVLIYDISDDLAKKRREQRNDKPEIFDDYELQRRINANYRNLPETLKNTSVKDTPFRFVDASKSIDDVLEESMKHLMPILPYTNVDMLNAL